MQIRCCQSRLFDGNIPFLKEEIHTVILIPLWLCPGGGGVHVGPRWPTDYMAVLSNNKESISTFNIRRVSRRRINVNLTTKAD